MLPFDINGDAESDENHTFSDKARAERVDASSMSRTNLCRRRRGRSASTREETMTEGVHEDREFSLGTMRVANLAVRTLGLPWLSRLCRY